MRSGDTVRQRGFALLIVLWTLGLLALLGTQLTAGARTQLRLAGDSRDRAMAEVAADAGVREAMFLLLGGKPIGSPGHPLQIRIGEAAVAIEAEDEAGKINPNTVSRDVLRGLLVAVGVDQPLAAQLAGEIADWRTRGRNSILGGQKIDQYRDHHLPYRSGDHGFTSLDEIGLVPDMTADILNRLRPWLSIYHEGEVNDAAGVTPAAVAIGDARLSSRNAPPAGLASHNMILHLRATAVVRGARFVRIAVVRKRAAANAAAPTLRDLVQVLAWE